VSGLEFLEPAPHSVSANMQLGGQIGVGLRCVGLQLSDQFDIQLIDGGQVPGTHGKLNPTWQV
jgi:hypothetical protein